MTKELKDIIIKNRQKTSPLNGWYLITVELAKFLLNLNIQNYRNINWGHVATLAREIKTGKWKRNGESIVFADSGILQDGQHRLHAVVRSGTPIVEYIVFDADDTRLYDVALGRTVNTLFRAEGKPIYSFNTSTGKSYLKYALGNDSIGTAYIHDFVEERIENIKKAESIVGCCKEKLAKKAPVAALVYCLLLSGEISEADMRSFFKIVNSGIYAGTAKDPSSALVLRKQLDEMVKGGGRGMQKTQLEIAYKALRDYKLGNSRCRFYKDDTDDALRMIKSVYDKYDKDPAIAA